MSHKIREKLRSFTEHLCDEPTCEFYGEITVQGVCHTNSPEILDLDKLERHERESEADLAVIRAAHYKNDPEEYIRWIEAHYLCSEINWAMTLDECVHLRAENSLLKKKLGKP